MKFAQLRKYLVEFKDENLFWVIPNYNLSPDLPHEQTTRNPRWAPDDLQHKRKKNLHLVERKVRMFQMQNSFQNQPHMITQEDPQEYVLKRTQFPRKSITEFNQRSLFQTSTWVIPNFRNKGEPKNHQNRLKSQSLNWIQQKPKTYLRK